MATHAIVHSTVSCMLRRVVTDDDGQVSVGTDPQGNPAVICTHAGNQPKTYVRLMPGESAFVMLTTSSSGATTPAQWATAIKNRTGKDPPDLKCALVENDFVTGVIAADIAVDPPPDERLMVECYSPLIGVGCTYNTATGLFSTPGGVLPPHTPGNTTDDEIIVPPTIIARP